MSGWQFVGFHFQRFSFQRFSFAKGLGAESCCVVRIPGGMFVLVFSFPPPEGLPCRGGGLAMASFVVRSGAGGVGRRPRQGNGEGVLVRDCARVTGGSSPFRKQFGESLAGAERAGVGGDVRPGFEITAATCESGERAGCQQAAPVVEAVVGIPLFRGIQHVRQVILVVDVRVLLVCDVHLITDAK